MSKSVFNQDVAFQFVIHTRMIFAKAVRLRFTPWVAASVLLLLIAACDTTPGPTLYDDDASFRPDPVVSGIEPENSWLAGVGTLTITGENFSEEPSDNLVYFNDRRAVVVSASPTELVVQTPNLPQSGINVRVNVLRAERFSNTVTYTLESAVEEFGGVANFEESYAIATDDESNLYVSLFANNSSVGIIRILPDGTRENYVSTTFRWDGLAFGPDERLYGVRSVRAIFRFPVGGGNQEVWAVAPDQAARFTSITIDAAGTVWVGGAGGNIYSADPSGTLTSVPVEGTVTAMLAHGGYLYAARNLDEITTVVRFEIQNGTLGAEEEVLALTQEMGSGIDVFSFAATADGAIFAGTDAEDPLILIEPDGSFETFYPGLLNPPAFSLAWGDGTMLYMSRTDLRQAPGRILSIDTQREGAP